MNSTQELDSVVERVSQLLHRHIGLRPEPGLRGRLGRCIRDGAADRGQDLRAYLDTLLVCSEARQSLFNRVTVQETAFFRHPEHFGLLAREILPTLARPVTIWSAACSTGQEAFSLAMLLEEHGVDGCVIATDVSTEALQRTGAGRYNTGELGGLSPERIACHLTRDGNAWVFKSNVRDRVGTFQHNLLNPVPSQVQACQVTFCRNVLIYLSPDYARAFLDKLADALPAATLFLGAAETIWHLSDRYETVRSGDTFSYRPRADDTGPDGASSRSLDPSSRPRRRIRHPVRPGPARDYTTTPVTGAVPDHVGASRLSASRGTVPSPRPPAPTGHASSAVLLAEVGERASAVGDSQAAVVAFRKCAYLEPHDPLAHLHLGLALESAGDQPSARRAYAAARHALTQVGSGPIDLATEGYTTADLIRLLDSKVAVSP